MNHTQPSWWTPCDYKQHYNRMRQCQSETVWEDKPLTHLCWPERCGQVRSHTVLKASRSWQGRDRTPCRGSQSTAWTFWPSPVRLQSLLQLIPIPAFLVQSERKEKQDLLMNYQSKWNYLPLTILSLGFSEAASADGDKTCKQVYLECIQGAAPLPPQSSQPSPQKWERNFLICYPFDRLIARIY